MTDPATVLLGPLVVPECRRALARGWIILVRALAAIASMTVALAAVWWWWTSEQFDPGYLPYNILRGSLTVIEGIAVVIALILSPAVIAGSLAGDKERGSMGLLLTTRVRTWEIVAGRLAGKLSQVTMILLAGVPALILVAALAGLGPGPLGSLVALPLAVALGAGGIAALASALSRKGRDALLAVYLIELLMMGAVGLTAFSPYPAVNRAIQAIDPFEAIGPASWSDAVGPPLTTSALWAGLGLVCLAVASWRLRAMCMRLLGGETRRGRGRRNLWVPPVGDRPMLWKELHVERAGTLGRVGTWLGLLLVLYLVSVSTVLGGIAAWAALGRADWEWYTWAVLALGALIANQGVVVGCLIQVAVALRAAVAISSERERGTWDALLTSPMTGEEIVRGKLLGSLFGLRWLLIAAAWAWTIALACGAMTGWEYFNLMAGTLVIGTFMVAVGVRVSLATSTATKAMSVTMGIWLAALAFCGAVAGIALGFLFLVLIFGTMAFYQMGLTASQNPAFFAAMPLTGGMVWTLLNLLAFVLATVALSSETRMRFDRIAGRLSGGEMAVLVDRIIHGRPQEPVFLEPAGTPADAVADGVA